MCDRIPWALRFCYFLTQLGERGPFLLTITKLHCLFGNSPGASQGEKREQFNFICISLAPSLPYSTKWPAFDCWARTLLTSGDESRDQKNEWTWPKLTPRYGPSQAPHLLDREIALFLSKRPLRDNKEAATTFCWISRSHKFYGPLRKRKIANYKIPLMVRCVLILQMLLYITYVLEI